MRGASVRIVLAFLLSLLVSAPAWAAPEKRVALVIGNNGYRYAPQLRNSVADARAMRQQLQATGFEVIYREDVDRHGLNDAIDAFVAKLSPQAVAVLFYSGHGIQLGSANFLIPVDLKAEKEGDVANDGVELTRLLDRVGQAQPRFSLAIVDACRDNPFQQVSRAFANQRGLAPPLDTAAGVMVVYSAGASQKALDRLSDADPDPNGLFTREFLKVMRQPGLTVQEAVTRVKTRVMEQAKSVGYTQTPAIYDQSVGTFYFVPPRDGSPVAGGDDAALARAQADKAAAEADRDRLAAELARLKAARGDAPPPQAKGGLIDDIRFHAGIARDQANAAARQGRAAAERAARVARRAELGRDPGLSVMEFSGGNRYAGEVRDGRKQGFGVEVFANGSRYAGQWRDDARDGAGIFTFPGGARFEGTHQAADRGGSGVFTGPDGTRYEGEWSAGREGGWGIYTTASGQRYEGQFVGGKPEGNGVEIGADGRPGAAGAWREGGFVAATE